MFVLHVPFSGGQASQWCFGPQLFIVKVIVTADQHVFFVTCLYRTKSNAAKSEVPWYVIYQPNQPHEMSDTLTGGIWNANRSHMQSLLEWFKFQFELFEFQLKQFESHAIWMTLISVSVWTEIQVIQAEIRTIFKLEFEPFELDLVFHTGAHALFQNPSCCFENEYVSLLSV